MCGSTCQVALSFACPLPMPHCPLRPLWLRFSKYRNLEERLLIPTHPVLKLKCSARLEVNFPTMKPLPHLSAFLARSLPSTSLALTRLPERMMSLVGQRSVE